MMPSNPGVPPSSPENCRIRSVAYSDISALTTLAIAALDEDNLFNYNFPYRKQFPDDCYESWHSIFTSWLYEPHTAFLCAESIQEGAWVLVGFARWDLDNTAILQYASEQPDQRTHIIQDGWSEMLWRNFSTVRTYASTILPYLIPPLQRRHANQKHIATFKATVAQTDSLFWDSLTGKFPNNVRITALAVHPDSRRAGIGTALVTWGMAFIGACQDRLGAESDLVVGVEATQDGKPLYEKLGFREVGTEEMRDEDGNVRVRTWIMVRESN
ncbi:hypothetical protein IQ07DRAFT_635022 [Pyrenochaeta sp. DS3sAY3a]|nr:hypothetical protein IQ07DRAFT_635022 [Pyrenochaeta sp. DS3sAY3a]